MFLWKPIGFLHNILRYSYMFSQLCSVKLIYFYYHIFRKWLLIQRVVSSVVCGLVSKWSVVGRPVGPWSVDLIKNPEKNMFWVVISLVHFGRGLFCYSNFFFFSIDNKEETNLIARSSHSNFWLFLKINV